MGVDCPRLEQTAAPWCAAEWCFGLSRFCPSLWTCLSAAGSALTAPRAGGRAWEQVQGLELGRAVLLWEDVAELGKTKFPVQQGED